MKGTNIDEIVREHAIEELPDTEVRCPVCGGTEVTLVEKTSTCIGGIGPVDPNHHWHYYRCACGLAFCRESHRGNVWYTTRPMGGGAPSKVLKGQPSCFETYLYTCAYEGCLGEVRLYSLAYDETSRTVKCSEGHSFELRRLEHAPSP